VISHRQFAGLSAFRTALSRFLRFSEGAARSAGITPTQYLLLLHIRGSPGKTWSTVGAIAARLQSSAHGTTALVNRCCASGLVRKRRSREDARRVEVHLTRLGLRLSTLIAHRHREELQSLRDVFRVAHVS
jgi:DNA-binding MarR family transcriptional regulator